MQDAVRSREKPGTRHRAGIGVGQKAGVRAGGRREGPEAEHLNGVTAGKPEVSAETTRGGGCSHGATPNSHEDMPCPGPEAPCQQHTRSTYSSTM